MGRVAPHPEHEGDPVTEAQPYTVTYFDEDSAAIATAEPHTVVFTGTITSGPFRGTPIGHTKPVLDDPAIQTVEHVTVNNGDLRRQVIEDITVLEAAVVATLADEVGCKCGHPHLGLATTRQLLDELRARAEVDGTINYRTVGNGN